jgi:hypothetical protein
MFGEYGGYGEYRPPEYPNSNQPTTQYKDNGELKIMTLKFYFECRNIHWYSDIPASMSLEYKKRGLRL